MKVSELIDCLKEMDEDLPVYCGGIRDKLSDSESVTDVVFAESIKKKDLLGVYLRTEQKRWAKNEIPKEGLRL